MDPVRVKALRSFILVMCEPLGTEVDGEWKDVGRHYIPFLLNFIEKRELKSVGGMREMESYDRAKTLLCERDGHNHLHLTTVLNADSAAGGDTFEICKFLVALVREMAISAPEKLVAAEKLVDDQSAEAMKEILLHLDDPSQWHPYESWPAILFPATELHLPPPSNTTRHTDQIDTSERHPSENRCGTPVPLASGRMVRTPRIQRTHSSPLAEVISSPRVRDARALRAKEDIIQGLRKTKYDLEDRQEELAGSLRQKEALIRELQHENKAKEAKIRDLENRCSELKRIAEDWEVDLRDSEKRLKEAGNEIASLNSVNIVKENQIRRLEIQLSNARNELSSANDLCNSRIANFDAKVKECENLELMIAECRAERDRNLKEMASANTSIEQKLKEVENELNEAKSTLKSEHDRFEQRIEEQSSHSTALSAELTRCQMNFDAKTVLYEDEIKSLRCRLKEQTNSAAADRDQSEKKRARLVSENEVLRKSLDRCEELLVTGIATLRREKEELVGELAELRNDLTSLKVVGDELLEMRLERDEAHAKLNRLHKQHDELVNKNEELARSISNLSIKHSLLENAYAELSDSHTLNTTTHEFAEREVKERLAVLEATLERERKVRVGVEKDSVAIGNQMRITLDLNSALQQLNEKLVDENEHYKRMFELLRSQKVAEAERCISRSLPSVDRTFSTANSVYSGFSSDTSRTVRNIAESNHCPPDTTTADEHADYNEFLDRFPCVKNRAQKAKEATMKVPLVGEHPNIEGVDECSTMMSSTLSGSCICVIVEDPPYAPSHYFSCSSPSPSIRSGSMKSMSRLMELHERNMLEKRVDMRNAAHAELSSFREDEIKENDFRSGHNFKPPTIAASATKKKTSLISKLLPLGDSSNRSSRREKKN